MKGSLLEITIFLTTDYENQWFEKSIGSGWGTRIRTWVNGARTRRPAARRSPSIINPF